MGTMTWAEAGRILAAVGRVFAWASTFVFWGIATWQFGRVPDKRAHLGKLFVILLVVSLVVGVLMTKCGGVRIEWR